MSLSDKIRDLELFTAEGIPVILHRLLNENDVREAVRELKEHLRGIPVKEIGEEGFDLATFQDQEEINRRIDEIFGEKLI